MTAQTRWSARVAYVGTRYHGWQRQPDLETVQGCIEKSLSRIANETLSVACAGRTDAGVHAHGQVIHWDAPQGHRRSDQWMRGCNALLPWDIKLRQVVEVPHAFDARRSATARVYEYRLDQRPVSSPFEAQRAWWIKQPLDVAAMSQAASFWLGEHDFSAFRAARCQSLSPYRHVMSVDFEVSASILSIRIRANAFLYHMVRLMVGVLVPIGLGRRAPDWAKDVLMSQQYPKACAMAPPYGLYLEEVMYPEGMI